MATEQGDINVHFVGEVSTLIGTWSVIYVLIRGRGHLVAVIVGGGLQQNMA